MMLFIFYFLRKKWGDKKKKAVKFYPESIFVSAKETSISQDPTKDKEEFFYFSLPEAL
jgi:hypothetical protein